VSRSAGILLSVLVIILCTAGVMAQEREIGNLTGRILTTDGSPLSDGMVFFFRDDSGPVPFPERYWRVPDFVGDLDREGRFFMKLPSGRYHIGAIRRKDGRKRIGPPDVGDLFYLSRSVTLEPVTFTVKKGQTTDAGDLSGATVYSGYPLTGITGVRGRVLDENSKPVEGAIVFAYSSARMIGMPLFVSERTGKDGRYLLRVERGGKYYLRVRSVYGGGPPVEGEIVGKFGEKSPAELTLETGRIREGVDIKVRRFSYSEMIQKRKDLRSNR